MNEIEFNMLLKNIKTSEYALERIHKFYYSKIVYHVGKKYGKSFAEDVAWEFFNDLLSTKTFEHVTNPTTWKLLNCDSLAKRKVMYESRYIYFSTDVFIAENNEVAFKEELYGDLYDAIKQLNEIEQRIIDLYYWEGYKLKEISEIINLPYNTIKQKHKRILKKLKKILPSIIQMDEQSY